MSSYVTDSFYVIFKSLFIMKITIPSSCEDSSMLTGSIIYVEIIYNYSLNKIISLGPIPCFLYLTIMLYIWKVIIAKSKMPQCGWLINGIHKWSVNSNLYAFFGLTVTNNFFSFLINVDRNSHIPVYISINFPSFPYIIILKQIIHLNFTW